MGALFDDGKEGRGAEALPYFLELAGQKGAEEGANADTGEKIAFASHGGPAGCVVTVGGVVQSPLHELGEGEGAMFPDLRSEGFWKGIGAWAQGGAVRQPGNFWKAELRVGREANTRGWNVSLPEGRLNGKEESLFSLHVDL